MAPGILRRMSPKSLALVLALVLPSALLAADQPKVTAYERSQGWRLLDRTDWHGYRLNKLPANWQERGGSLVGNAGAALVSNDDFGDFELTFDWKVAPGGNGALFFKVFEDETAPEKSGSVMQLAGHGDTLGGNGLAAPDRKLTPQFDVWYRCKIVVFGNQVEYWINGEKVMGYMLDSPDWRKAIAASANPTVAKFVTERGGRVAFVGEGLEVRNVKVRGI
jgi:hypothetical protein